MVGGIVAIAPSGLSGSLENSPRINLHLTQVWNKSDPSQT